MSDKADLISLMLPKRPRCDIGMLFFTHGTGEEDKNAEMLRKIVEGRLFSDIYLPDSCIFSKIHETERIVCCSGLHVWKLYFHEIFNLFLYPLC